nr:MAG TPA: hypothetical protein [Caudoviricetes sp.]
MFCRKVSEIPCFEAGKPFRRSGFLASLYLEV